MTTPAQEAKKIFDRFYTEISEVLIINNVAERRVSKIAKQCSLLLCDSHINEQREVEEMVGQGFNLDKWLSIKQEIEKM